MMTRFEMLCGVVLWAGATWGMWCLASDVIPQEELPQAVLHTIQQRFPKAQIEHSKRDHEEGRAVFELRLREKLGDQEYRRVEVEIAPNGEIVEIEQPIRLSELPDEVVAAIGRDYPQGTLQRASQVLKKDRLVWYEVKLSQLDGSRFEIECTPGGTILDVDED